MAGHVGWTVAQAPLHRVPWAARMCACLQTGQTPSTKNMPIMPMLRSMREGASGGAAGGGGRDVGGQGAGGQGADGRRSIMLSLPYRTPTGTGEMIVESSMLDVEGHQRLRRLALGVLRRSPADPIIPVGTGLDPLADPDGPYTLATREIGEAPLMEGPVSAESLLDAWEHHLAALAHAAPTAWATWCEWRRFDPEAPGPLPGGSWRMDIPWGAQDKHLLRVDARTDPETARRAMGAIQRVAWIARHLGPVSDLQWRPGPGAPSEGVEGLEAWALGGQMLAAERVFGPA